MKKKSLFLFLAFVIVPWLCAGDWHFLLFDFIHERFVCCGFHAEVNFFVLIVMATLFMLSVMVSVLLIVSRHYCGSWCPTTFFGYVENGVFSRMTGGGILKSILLLLIHALFSFSFVAYGIDGHELLSMFIRAEPHVAVIGVVVLTFVFLTITVVLKGWYCKNMCPYGVLSFMLRGQRYALWGMVIIVACIIMMAYFSLSQHLSYCLLSNGELYR